ncbi:MULTISPECIES: MarR family winged helix-turn-helix transcriptional regulator [unclassified Rhodococcus (in: high G+C Gram-positive bacteria)]|uniref:MarR family winged helix-turn-helix transcriptional regulator n=1 Tax=unclassified Rhodococcus (in: high G+C Gram-positive bacteria) TaxID=192944 RepID=UPI00163A9B13|nr:MULTISPECIES: MarR family transcriptional regulator [unclassified Rhodococcus (in: high G+C Gram-positive bacteria)]MBC2640640.1 winged helix DNA-binding protein [Rhodococcus sp. 3A]MBC2894615.1 winged helix DNA-binding protein [Rhodococcus sp. 4CII]
MSTARDTLECDDASDLSATTLVAAVLQAQKTILRQLDAVLSPLGLSFPRYEVLALVGAAPDGVVPMVRLWRTLDRHPTTIGSLVDRLEGAGLVTRATNRADRRETLVTITDKGRGTASSAARAIDQVPVADADLMRRLSVDLRTLIACSAAEAAIGDRPPNSPLGQRDAKRAAS